MSDSAPAVPRLHVVTDDAVLEEADFAAWAERVLEAGGRRLALHLRGPRTGGRRVHDVAVGLASSARRTGSALLVNDRVDVALALEGVGAHLGARSLPVAEARRLLGPSRLLGVSVHRREEAAEAAREGANLVFVGTVFATRSHPDRTGIGAVGFDRIRRSAHGVPALAIGGVAPEQVAALVHGGAHGVAVLRGVWRAEDPAAAVARYLDAIAAKQESLEQA